VARLDPPETGAGWTGNQIKEYFVDQYGDRVLAEPPRRGLNWLVYILPPLLLLAGVFILYRVLVKMRQRPVASNLPAPSDPVRDPYIARLEDELRRRQKNQ